MKTIWLPARLCYDGSQLRAHWLLRHCGVVGDGMAAFRGPCAVSRAEMADLADLDGPGITADDMLHFVWESFQQTDLLLAVHRQRLLSAQAAELLAELAPQRRVRRDGDDLWLGDGKLSVSIATATSVSSLIHFGVNATAGGAPVRTATLQDLGVDVEDFGRRLLQRVADEQDAIAEARAKVRSKGEWGE
jgi:hypothetical protein